MYTLSKYTNPDRNCSMQKLAVHPCTKMNGVREHLMCHAEMKLRILASY